MIDARAVPGKASARYGLAVAALSIATLFALPGVAEACAVCFQAKTDASRVAFIAATGGMTAAPLLLIGGVAWWVRKRFRTAAEQEAALERGAALGRRASL